MKHILFITAALWMFVGCSSKTQCSSNTEYSSCNSNGCFWDGSACSEKPASITCDLFKIDSYCNQQVLPQGGACFWNGTSCALITNPEQAETDNACKATGNELIQGVCYAKSNQACANIVSSSVCNVTQGSDGPCYYDGSCQVKPTGAASCNLLKSASTCLVAGCKWTASQTPPAPLSPACQATANPRCYRDSTFGAQYCCAENTGGCKQTDPNCEPSTTLGVLTCGVKSSVTCTINSTSTACCSGTSCTENNPNCIYNERAGSCS